MDQTILITPYHSDIWFRVQSLGVEITVKGSDPSEQTNTSGDWSQILVPMAEKNGDWSPNQNICKEGSVPFVKFITCGISPYLEIYNLGVLSGDKLQIIES